MATAQAVVEQFIDAFYRGDPTARTYLADDLTFTGPAAQFEGADAYLKVAAHVASGVTRLDVHKVIADERDVAVFYDLVVDHHVGRIPLAEWHHVVDDKIVAIRVIFDNAPFIRSANRERPSTTAIDPVCKMEVDRASAPATVSYGGSTYCFCNPGCAEAFQTSPEDYVSAAN